jgi:hypothetical protein
MANSQSKPKGALIAALVCFVLGIAGCGFAASRAVPFISDLADFVSELDNFATNNPMGEPVSFTAGGDDGLVLLSDEAACTGDGPDGAVRFEAYEGFGPGTNVELNGTSMSGYILFETRSGADYSITCGSAGTGSFLVTSAPTFLVEGAPGLLGGLLAFLGGAFFVFLSIVLLIVGLVQRSRWSKRNAGQQPYGQPGPPAYGSGQAPPPPGGAPGWGSAPAGGGQVPPPPPTSGTPGAPYLPPPAPAQTPPPPPPPSPGDPGQPPPPPPGAGTQ